MKTRLKVIMIAASIAMYYFAAFGQIVPVTPYPFLSTTPATPIAGKDSVVVLVALGSASNACMAPTFTNTSFTIKQSPLTIYPPLFNVTVSYTEVPVPPGKACPMIYAPVDYGPSFELGKLALGNYSVTDQVSGKLVGAFSVSLQATTSHDTVTVTPASPTTKDSLHFDLFNANLDCCTQYYNKTVSVGDSVITLIFGYSDAGTCACLVAGSHTAFASAPQKAGKYAIYKEQGIYCQTPPCPLVPGPIQLEKVGQVVVGAGTAIDIQPKSAVYSGLVLRQSNRTLQLEYASVPFERLSARVFNARGMVVGQMERVSGASGFNRLVWNAAAPGIFIISIERNGVQVLSQTAVISR